MWARSLLSRPPLRSVRESKDATVEFPLIAVSLKEATQLKKLALAAVFGMLFMMVPLTTMGQAGAASNATVRIIHGIPGGPTVDVWIDGAAAKAALVQATSFDASLAPGTHAVVVCAPSATPPTPLTAGACTAPAGTVLSATISVASGTTYSMVINSSGGPPFLSQFADNGSPTANGKARFQFNNATAAPVAIAVCLNGTANPGLSATAGLSAITEVAAGAYTLGTSVGGGACTGVTPINLAAGTSFVLTATINGSQGTPACGANCVQVLVVGEGRPTNVAAIPAFCSAVLPLKTASDGLKTVLGGITVGTPSTYPTAAAVNTAVDATVAAIAAGDKSVPALIKPQWEILTAGLRTLTTGLQAVGGDVSLLPPAQLTAIVDGVNATPSAETEAATAALTAWYLVNCTPAAAPAAAATGTPQFTG
jgi:hypothetical protein